jgi:hypothetical protein
MAENCPAVGGNHSVHKKRISKLETKKGGETSEALLRLIKEKSGEQGGDSETLKGTER